MLIVMFLSIIKCCVKNNINTNKVNNKDHSNKISSKNKNRFKKLYYHQLTIQDKTHQFTNNSIVYSSVVKIIIGIVLVVVIKDNIKIPNEHPVRWTKQQHYHLPHHQNHPCDKCSVNNYVDTTSIKLIVLIMLVIISKSKIVRGPCKKAQQVNQSSPPLRNYKIVLMHSVEKYHV